LGERGCAIGCVVMWIVRHKKSGYIFSPNGWISRLDVLPESIRPVYSSPQTAITAVKACGLLDRTNITLDDLEVENVVDSP